MTSNQAAQSVAVLNRVSHSKELKFAGDGVLLAGQIDYPDVPRPASGYPVVFILHHAGCNAHECYLPYVDMALEAGYAVFRWDKRGTGRSGAGGRGSTTQDAINAYIVALEQDNVDPRGAVILALGAGTGLLGSSFGLFARHQPPRGVMLVSNVLDDQAILAIEAPVQIIMSEDDWAPWPTYAVAACEAHSAAYKYGASYYIAKSLDGSPLDLNDVEQSFHPGARKVMLTWLKNTRPVFGLT
jgi:hypothetical protein